MGLGSAVKRYEMKYPGVTFVIGTGMVFRQVTAPPRVLEELNGGWLPGPSLPLCNMSKALG